jgi:hypothetical protein
MVTEAVMVGVRVEGVRACRSLLNIRQMIAVGVQERSWDGFRRRFGRLSRSGGVVGLRGEGAGRTRGKRQGWQEKLGDEQTVEEVPASGAGSQTA